MSLSLSLSPTLRRLIRGSLLVLPALVLIGLVAPAHPAGAAAGPGCGSVLTADVSLSADVLNCNGSGLVIGAAGITVNLNGHVVRSNGTASATGIDNSGGFDNVTVRNGTVRGFAVGVQFSNVTGSRIGQITATANTTGVVLLASPGNIVNRSNLDRNGQGLVVRVSDNTTVQLTSATGNTGIGVLDDGPSTGNRYDGNDVNRNGGVGLDLIAVNQTVVTGNRTNGNGNDGLFVTGAISALRIELNTASRNTRNGINIRSAGATVTQNTANTNGAAGIRAVAGTVDGGGNQATGNTAVNCQGVTCT